MKELSESLGLVFLVEPWLPSVLIAVVATVVAHFVASFLLHRLLKVSLTTTSYWDNTLVYAALKPLPMAIWVVGIAFAASIVRKYTEDDFFNFVPMLRDVGIMTCLAWFFMRLIGEASGNYLRMRLAEGEEVDHTTVDALSKLARLVVVITSALVVMQTMGFSIGGLLAAGGIGGIALGFAAKDLLANFFGGLTIYLDRPFDVGNWIRSPDKDIEGTVEMISWRHTRIRRFNKNPIYVPNSVFTTIVVENPSRMTHRRLHFNVGIRYEDVGVMAAIADDIKAMLIAHPDIDEEQTLIVNFNAFGPSSLDLMIYTFTRTVVWVEFHAVKQSVLLKIAEIITKHGAEIAFPTQTLHIASQVEAESPDQPSDPEKQKS
ncbi:MAG: mechanosensitive ion channel family protein [Nitrosomonadales bacterium]|nr:mechanosensitive ion channel family protein [Nitrosomonadales bacterium]